MHAFERTLVHLYAYVFICALISNTNFYKYAYINKLQEKIYLRGQGRSFSYLFNNKLYAVKKQATMRMHTHIHTQRKA